MSLHFTLFETVALFASALVANFMVCDTPNILYTLEYQTDSQQVLDGRSNYLEGSLLCASYVIIAVAAAFYPDESQQSSL